MIERKKTMSTLTEGLAPCPFCGGTEITLSYSGQPSTNWFLTCNKCKARGPETFDISASGGKGPSEKVASDWNRRALLSEAKAASVDWKGPWICNLCGKIFEAKSKYVSDATHPDSIQRHIKYDDCVVGCKMLPHERRKTTATPAPVAVNDAAKARTRLIQWALSHPGIAGQFTPQTVIDIVDVVLTREPEPEAGKGEGVSDLLATPAPAEFAREVRDTLEWILSRGDGSGVVACPQDYSYYVKPMQEKARALFSRLPKEAKTDLDITQQEIDAAAAVLRSKYPTPGKEEET